MMHTREPDLTTGGVADACGYMRIICWGTGGPTAAQMALVNLSFLLPAAVGWLYLRRGAWRTGVQRQ